MPAISFRTTRSTQLMLHRFKLDDAAEMHDLPRWVRPPGIVSIRPNNSARATKSLRSAVQAATGSVPGRNPRSCAAMSSGARCSKGTMCRPSKENVLRPLRCYMVRTVDVNPAEGARPCVNVRPDGERLRTATGKGEQENAYSRSRPTCLIAGAFDAVGVSKQCRTSRCFPKSASTGISRSKDDFDCRLSQRVQERGTGGVLLDQLWPSIPITRARGLDGLRTTRSGLSGLSVHQLRCRVSGSHPGHRIAAAKQGGKCGNCPRSHAGLF